MSKNPFLNGASVNWIYTAGQWTTFRGPALISQTAVRTATRSWHFLYQMSRCFLCKGIQRHPMQSPIISAALPILKIKATLTRYTILPAMFPVLYSFCFGKYWLHRSKYGIIKANPVLLPNDHEWGKYINNCPYHSFINLFIFYRACIAVVLLLFTVIMPLRFIFHLRLLLFCD